MHGNTEGLPDTIKYPEEKIMLSKLVIAAISPVGTALVMGIVALLLARLKRHAWRRTAFALGAFAIAWLWLWSLPLASYWLRGQLEVETGPRTVDELPTAQAAVVLGGGIRSARPPLRPYPDLGSSADRVWHAARLYHAGKAPLLVLSGGTEHRGEAPEAQAMREFLADLGVPASATMLEGESTTTTENALYSAPMLRARGVHKVLLVTSALHMRRARGLFERQGFEVVPAPTDFEVTGRPFEWRDLVPEGEALEGSGRAIKEIVGRLAGR